MTNTVHDLSTESGRWLGLDGARVLVAGAGGIGAACVEAYAAVGADVFVVDRDEGRIDALRRDRHGDHGSVRGAGLDLAAPGSGEQAVEAAVEALGGLDVLLHAVGVNDRRPILDFAEEEWSRILRINVDSAFQLAQAAGRRMVAQGHGRIVLLSSVAGLMAHKNHGPYAVSKSAINQLARVMANEWAASGVTVNTIAPGYIETDLTRDHLAKPGVRENLVSLVPAGRLGTPEEVTGPALFLSSVHAGFVTGHVLYADGGRTLV
ncbi:MAG: SDR family oxidoreductase [Microbacterium sp.]|uniref:SDR family NAD(P)-dependent oxidoreductase n=1 Tax=Microbacterium sp. TaxID=51671 RepID=UPI0039E32FF7